MVAVTTLEVRQVTPNAGLKEVFVIGSMATGETWDATGYFTTIYGVYLTGTTGLLKACTYSALEVTVGTVVTANHFMRVWGV